MNVLHVQGHGKLPDSLRWAAQIGCLRGLVRPTPGNDAESVGRCSAHSRFKATDRSVRHTLHNCNSNSNSYYHYFFINKSV
jgi:hypothetical protein